MQRFVEFGVPSRHKHIQTHTFRQSSHAYFEAVERMNSEILPFSFSQTEAKKGINMEIHLTFNLTSKTISNIIRFGCEKRVAITSKSCVHFIQKSVKRIKHRKQLPTSLCIYSAYALCSSVQARSKIPERTVSGHETQRSSLSITATKYSPGNFRMRGAIDLLCSHL